MNSQTNQRTNRITTAVHPWDDLLQPMQKRCATPGGSGAGDVSDTDRVMLALAQALQQRDSHTAGHCERMAFIGVAIGIFLGLDRADLLTLYRGGYLHDIGKIAIPDAVLFKPQPLTPEEWGIMQTHPARGAEICSCMPSLSPVVPIIRHHHEKWDGSGYPDKLRGAGIPLMARVMQMADIYDALTNPRPYKAAYTPEQALRLMRDETDRGWRDPEMFKVFLALHQDVIAKAGEYTGGGDCNLEAMRTALLQHNGGDR